MAAVISRAAELAKVTAVDTLAPTSAATLLITHATSVSPTSTL